MNNLKPFFFVGLAALLAGCTTSSQVQELIDASKQDYTEQLAAHTKSIDVLKKSSMTGLDKSKQNGEALEQIQLELVELAKKIEVVKGYTEASKVLASANTVKVAELETAVQANHRQVDETVQKLAEIDKLFENVMLRHYEMIVESANEAMSSLKSESRAAATNTPPVKLDEPIEIVAPDTSVPKTNSAAAEL